MERLNFTQTQKLKSHKSVQSSDFYAMAKARVDTLNDQEGNYTGYACSKCKNKGFTAILREDGSFFVRDCTCMPMRRCIRQMESSGLSKTIKNQTFDSFEATEAWQIQLKEKVAQYAKSPEGWLMLGGSAGLRQDPSLYRRMPGDPAAGRIPFIYALAGVHRKAQGTQYRSCGAVFPAGQMQTDPLALH